MSEEQRKQVLRLPKRHSRERAARPDPKLGGRIVRAQSLRGAIAAALLAIIAFSVVWAMLSTALDRVFPWMTVVQGLIIGLAVRRAGRGLDWRFPVIAAVAAIVDEVITAADAIYALAAAGVAAYFANRRLTRDQYTSYRAWQENGKAGR
jgi:hypothetical protein